MKESRRQDIKKRPLTGVRAQDLTASSNNLRHKITDEVKSPRRNEILPQLKEPLKPNGSK